MKPDEELRRAERAERLLADPLIKEALEHIEAECVRLFHECAPSDADTLRAVKAMDYFRLKFVAFFRSAVVSGSVAKVELDRQSLMQKARDRLLRRV